MDVVDSHSRSRLPAVRSSQDVPRIAEVENDHAVADLVLVSLIVSANIPPHGAGCPIQTLERQPSAIYRDFGSIELAASEPAGLDVLTAVDQSACESTVGAIIVTEREERLTARRVEFKLSLTWPAPSVGYDPVAVGPERGG